MKIKKSIINRAIKAYRTDQKRAFDHMKSLYFLLSLVVFIIALVGLFASPDSFFGCNIAGGTSLAVMAVIGSIDDVSDKYTSGSDLAYQVYLVDVSQIDRTKSFPEANANREVASLPMISGEYMHYFEAHTIPEYESSVEKGDITTTGTNTLTIIMGGMRDKLLDFQEEHTGGKFIVIFKSIQSKGWLILGTLDSPVILKKSESKHNKDGRYITFTFERSSVVQYHHYIGAFVTVPDVVNAVDSVTLAIQAGVDQYQIPAGSAATYAISKVSGITDSDKGRVITLIGTAASNAATIADGALFTLIDGATWTAKSGSRISLRILDTNTLVEVDGSRVQTA